MSILSKLFAPKVVRTVHMLTRIYTDPVDIAHWQDQIKNHPEQFSMIVEATDRGMVSTLNDRQPRDVSPAAETKAGSVTIDIVPHLPVAADQSVYNEVIETFGDKPVAVSEDIKQTMSVLAGDVIETDSEDSSDLIDIVRAVELQDAADNAAPGTLAAMLDPKTIETLGLIH